MGLTKAQCAAKKAWATRKKNQRRAHKGGSGKGGKKKHKVPAIGFKRIKKGSRKGEVFPVLTPGQKAWRTRRAREGKKPTTMPLRSVYTRQWEMPSRSQKDKFYKVSLRTDGVWMCSCPAWIFQGGPIADRTSCPHIQEAQRIAGFLGGNPNEPSA